MTEVMDNTELLGHTAAMIDHPEVESPELGTTDIVTEVLRYQDAEIVGDELI